MERRGRGSSALLCGLAVFTSGCGDADQDLVADAPPAVQQAPPARPPDVIHTADGVVVQVSPDGVVIRHKAVPAAGWAEPGVHAFLPRDHHQLALLRVGQPVAFTFIAQGPEFQLTSVIPRQASGEQQTPEGTSAR